MKDVPGACEQSNQHKLWCRDLLRPGNDSVNMPNKIREDLQVVDDKSFPYIYEENVTIKLKSFDAIVRCNIYRPKTTTPVPVLMTYGPYGKDIHYKE